MSRDDSRDEEILEYLEEMSGDLDRNQRGRLAHSVSVSAAKDHLFLNQLKKVQEQILSKKYTVGAQYRPRKDKKTARVLNIMLSDLHYGAALDSREVSYQFGPLEEARRTAEVVRQVSEYKIEHRDETELCVHLMGDLIQNQLHDPRDGEPLAWQIGTASHILTQALVFLASKFKRVSVFCATGNHGRNTARHHDRAINQKWDSNETIVYHHIKAATKHLKNVTVHIPLTPYYTFEQFGMRGFCTHGDTVLMPGFPGKSINVSSVKAQIDAINGKLEGSKRYSMFGVGHVHTYSCTMLPNRVVFMSNGCLIPTDAYAQSKGFIDTTCCQSLWETVPGYMVGDRREILVDSDTDKDSSLDSIIQPFENF